MNSLRTDDIPGARPTFRHAPKAFIRERQLPTYNFRSDYQMPQESRYYRHPEPKYISEVHMSESHLQSPKPNNMNSYQEPLRNSNLYERKERTLGIQPVYSKVLNAEKPYENLGNVKVPSKTVELIRDPYNKIHNQATDAIGKRVSSGSGSNDIKSSSGSQRENNVFRGLGFNIISNSKYTYEFEKTFDRRGRSFSGR